MKPATPVVVFLTDFGDRDPYVAQMKGCLISLRPAVRFLDLTHAVEPFQIRQGSFILGQTVPWFPKGTIFVAVVDPGVGSERRAIAVRTRGGRFLVGPDNGVFTDALRLDPMQGAVALDRPEWFGVEARSSTFHGRDLFTPVAAHLSGGIAFQELGTEIDSLVLLSSPPPFTGQGGVADVVHVDHFGNLILNWTTPRQEPEGGSGVVRFAEAGVPFTQATCYAQLETGALGLLAGSQGRMEVAAGRASAAAILKAKAGDRLRFEFEGGT